MHLKRLYMHGFKSFAGVTKLDFEPGVVAVVGPNGSGKSNVADAVRWALGEQSTRTLRTKKSEELVFAGTDKRPKASLAEVRLLFDNSDGRAPIDYSEIEISRLLYRSGESEYRLNGRRTPLREVQQLLAAAGFGLNSYAIIGQGMIDGMILATPAERKLLFDEASGIHVHEMKREAALRKLDATRSNLIRTRDVLSELGPRLLLLEQAASSERDREQLTAELAAVRVRHVGVGQRLYSSRVSQLTGQLQAVRTALEQASGSVEALSLERAAIQKQQAAHEKSRSSHATRLASLESRRDKLANQLSVKRAEQSYLVEVQGRVGEQSRQIAEQEVALADQLARGQVIATRITAAKLVEASKTAAVEQFGTQLTTIQEELASLRQETTETSQREYLQHALAIIRELSTQLGTREEVDHESIRLMLHKVGRLLSHATGEVQAEVGVRQKAAQDRLSLLVAERELASEEYTSAVIALRSLELDEAHSRSTVDRLNAQLEALARSFGDSNSKTAVAAETRKTEIEHLERDFATVGSELSELRAEGSQAASAGDSSRIFELAARLEAARTEQASLEAQKSSLVGMLEQSEDRCSYFSSLVVAIGGPSVVPGESETAALTEEQLDSLERQMQSLEAQLGALPTAVTAIIDYETEKQRFDYLKAQTEDLEKAILDLGEVTTSLEKLISEQFDQGFGGISKQFTHYFTRLFGGGRAELVLRPGESDEYGIDIVAMPPGKRMEALSVLSGGERSMVGIALLAAILSVNPSPTVVLDEVDAALDEANSSRFSSMLIEMGRSTQLVVITHNRQTMQAAHSLYGVTMDTHHVSSVLSMRLEQAAELAAR
jgi:chromosome segregation protein